MSDPLQVQPPPPLPDRPPSLWRESIREHKPPPVDHPEEVGFGGTLLLLVINRVLAPFTLVSALVHGIGLFAKPGVWWKFTNPESSHYHPLWSTAIFYEEGGKTIQLIASIVLLWPLIARKKIFKPWMIFYLGATLVYTLGDITLGYFIPAIETGYGAGTVWKLFFSVFYAAVWISYLSRSHRVRNTFIN